MRSAIVFSALALCLVFAANLLAQDEVPQPHKIDVAMEKCKKEHPGNSNVTGCYGSAETAWGEDVEKTYAELIKIAPASWKEVFKASQAAWEKYRDAEFELSDKKYAGRKGTGYISTKIIGKLHIIKARALELEDWLKYPFPAN